ncbi:MAG TPA: hypothetical protein VMT55_00145 [Candidatus Sulfotelmatobacter sp.]|nr:hypothetical protein [Candidatus Sulfotelmatobacter sp.]
MPYVLDANGIQIATQTELVEFLTGWYQQIYGQDIDLSSSTQDGQMLRTYVQAQQDAAGLVLQDYNSRDANSCTGTQLDTLFWWLPRQGGDFTVQPVTVVTNTATTLYGQDQTVQPVYTVEDSNGNQYQLQTTQSPAGAGSYVYTFVAVEPGNVTSPLNTITTQVTVNLAVDSVNNPTTYTSAGVNTETDYDYRLRALASADLPSQGFFDSLYAALGIVPQAAKITLYENIGDTTSPNSVCSVAGVPAHGIWAVVQGSAQPKDIATAIYNQRTDGCNMRGGQSYEITRLDGSTFAVLWDFVENQNLYVKFTAGSIDGINPPDYAGILDGLSALVVLSAGQSFNINELATLVQQLDPNTLVTSAGLGLAGGGPFSNVLVPSSAIQQLTLAKARIYILPLLLLPETDTVATLATVQFATYGGSQTGYTYSITHNDSGGSINSGSGLYTAGGSTGTDTIKVEDSDGNTTTATVTVT